MSTFFSRRVFCGSVAGCVSLSALPLGFAQPAAEQPAEMMLSIGNYGMPSFKVEDAVRLIAGLGFDGIELSVMPDWDSAPTKLTGERRAALGRMLADQGLALTSLMESLSPSPNDAEHQKSLDRLKLAAELGRDLSPQQPPLIQTVLGGGVWNDKKELFRDRLGDWLQIAESTKTTIAIKPHRGGAMSQPAEAAWLLAQLGKPRSLGMVYDYSHYALRNLSIAETVKTAFPITVLIVVKDIARKGEQVEFELPGETNTIDHGGILTSFYELGYRKDVCCEVSAQVSRRPGYDPAIAAKTCYDNMSQVFEKAKIPRRKPVPSAKVPAP